MAAADRDKMKLAILELEADGVEHPGAEIDMHVARVLGASAKDLSELHAKTNRSVFLNRVDWVKGSLTTAGFHEEVDKADGQKVYRITPRGREELSLRRRRQELTRLAYGGGKKSAT